MRDTPTLSTTLSEMAAQTHGWDLVHVLSFASLNRAIADAFGRRRGIDHVRRHDGAGTSQRIRGHVDALMITGGAGRWLELSISLRDLMLEGQIIAPVSRLTVDVALEDRARPTEHGRRVSFCLPERPQNIRVIRFSAEGIDRQSAASIKHLLSDWLVGQRPLHRLVPALATVTCDSGTVPALGSDYCALAPTSVRYAVILDALAMLCMTEGREAPGGRAISPMLAAGSDAGLVLRDGLLSPDRIQDETARLLGVAQQSMHWIGGMALSPKAFTMTGTHSLTGAAQPVSPRTTDRE